MLLSERVRPLEVGPGDGQLCHNVARGVEPKRKKVAEAEKNLRLAQKDLAGTKEQLAALNSQLTTLRDQFADKTAEQQVCPCCQKLTLSASRNYPVLL